MSESIYQQDHENIIRLMEENRKLFCKCVRDGMRAMAVTRAPFPQLLVLLLLALRLSQPEALICEWLGEARRSSVNADPPPPTLMLKLLPISISAPRTFMWSSRAYCP